ncbi:MAG: asparaginase, partial [Betaproteobacteria bacterium]
MDWTALIQTDRAGLTECVHFGAIAVVDAQGRLLASAGNPELMT